MQITAVKKCEQKNTATSGKVIKAVIPLKFMSIFIYIYIYLFIYLFTAIGLLPGGSGYFTCKKHEIGYY